MTSIHNLSQSEFAQYEEEMAAHAEETFEMWVESMEEDAREGWRDLAVWVKEVGRTSRYIEVSLDGYVLWNAMYRNESPGGWKEINFMEVGSDRKCMTVEQYEETGWLPQAGWKWNEFTDAFIVPDWAEKAGF